MWVLLSSTDLSACEMWIPESSSSPNQVSPFKLLPGFHLVVASAGGLVCLQRKFSDDYERPDTRFHELVVGNPVTDEWVQLPLPQKREVEWPHFTMELVGEGGEFRVAMFGRRSGATTGSRLCYIYDSLLECWSETEIHFPAKDPGATRAYFDLCKDRWVIDAISSVRIKTGLERGDGEEHVLPSEQYNYHGFCFWEHGGHRYFASPWFSSMQMHVAISGYGVWRVEEASGKLELVSAAWVGQFVDKQLLTFLQTSVIHMVCPNARGRYVAFASVLADEHPAYPAVLYDLNSGCWSSVVRPCDCVEHSRVDFWQNDYASAILYSPSLLAPKVGNTTSPGKHHSRAAAEAIIQCPKTSNQ